MKKERLFLSRKNRCKKQLALFNSFAAQYAKRPRIEGEQSSWPKHTKIVHLVFWESFNVWYKKYSDRFLLKKRDDRSLALLDIFKIFIARNGDIFSFEKHIYLIFSYQTYILFSYLVIQGNSIKSQLLLDSSKEVFAPSDSNFFFIPPQAGAHFPLPRGQLSSLH